jgi:hypothetical protein
MGEGLLDFLKTPAGQGLLGAVAGGLAGAKRGAPLNTLGRAGVGGLLAYNSGVSNQMDQQKFETQQAAEKRKMDAMANYRGTLPVDQQNVFDVAPEEYLKNTAFQKPQLVEVADPTDPLRIKKVWLKPGQTADQGVSAGLGTLPEILDQRVQDAKTKIAQAGRSQSQTNVFNNTKDDFKNERDLRNDFSGLPTTKAFSEVRSAYDQIHTALKSTSPAGDLAAATKFMKILDPGSVVRESELGMAMAATGALDRFQNYAQMTINGTKLTPKQREDFGQLSRKLYEAAEGRYNQTADEYRGIASQYNLDPERVAKPASMQPRNQAPAKPPMKGQVVDGHKFLGGNPADPNSWVKQ